MQESVLNKVADPKTATLLEKGYQYRCFKVNFLKFSRTSLWQNTFGRMLPCKPEIPQKIKPSQTFFTSFKQSFSGTLFMLLKLQGSSSLIELIFMKLSGIIITIYVIMLHAVDLNTSFSEFISYGISIMNRSLKGPYVLDFITQ